MAVIRTRHHPVPPGWELSKIGQAWIIESLPGDDRHSGISMRDHLRDLFVAHDMNVEVTFRQVASAAQLFAALKTPERRPRGSGPKSPASAFDEQDGYDLTELGTQFVHYAMTDLPPKIEFKTEAEAWVPVAIPIR
jgi:hypothetical protein